MRVGSLEWKHAVVDRLQEDLIQQKQRSMQNNLIIHNIAESEGEDLFVKLSDFFRSALLISSEAMDKIQVHKMHRMGFKRNDKFCRPLIINVDERTKSIILSHTKHLKGKPQNVYVQMPRELIERKNQLLPHYKDARSRNIPAKWIGDKLKLNDKTVAVERPQAAKSGSISADKSVGRTVCRTPKINVKGSLFQGSKVDISDPQDALAALHAVYKAPDVGGATHNIYAYRVSSGGQITSYYDDDGEHGAGRRILKMMEDNHVTNSLICVTRWYGGNHIGPIRFDCIVDCAKEAIVMPI